MTSYAPYPFTVDTLLTKLETALRAGLTPADRQMGPLDMLTIQIIVDKVLKAEFLPPVIKSPTI